jgi:class 3 adenylate cyclase
VDICESTKLYESVGDEQALAAIAACLNLIRSSVMTSGGQVVKTIGDEILATFPSAETAAFAASAMNTAVASLPNVGKAKLAIRTGFHFGPVLQQNADIFGDTVNLAARLVKLAVPGQIILSGPTADSLPRHFASFKRPLYALEVKGKADEVQLCELMWRRADNMTIAGSTRTTTKIKVPVLRLLHNGTELIYQRRDEGLVIGREPGCHLVIESLKASRRHCVITRRQDKFILLDQSTNGTFVTPEGDSEVELRREEIMLGSHGWIAIGQPKDCSDSVIEYHVE